MMKNAVELAVAHQVQEEYQAESKATVDTSSKVGGFNYDSLKLLIKQDEWYNIPECIRTCITTLIKCVENQKVVIEYNSRNLTTKLTTLENNVQLNQSVAKRLESDHNNRFNSQAKSLNENIKKLSTMVEE